MSKVNSVREASQLLGSRVDENGFDSELVATSEVETSDQTFFERRREKSRG